MNSKIIMIALASAIPAFFLGTTVSLVLSLDGHCACEGASGNMVAVSSANAAQQLSESSSNRSVLNFNQRPVQLPIWVEDVVQERLQMERQNLAKQQQQQPVEAVNPKKEDPDDEEEEERPDRIPLWVEDVVRERLEEEHQHFAEQFGLGQENKDNNLRQSTGSEVGGKLVFDQSRVGNYITGMAYTSKDEFTKTFDLGVPLDSQRSGSTEVLMIYSNKKTLPAAVMKKITPGLAQLSPEEATGNCDYLSVILTDHGDSKMRNQCLAIVPQYESYHIQRWGRFNEEQRIVEPGHPLQLIPFSTKKKGRTEYRPPSLVQTKKMFDLLSLYLKNLPDVTSELEAILKPIAIDNTIIVMTCNFGQSELLINFVCSAHARGFNISNVVVFTTDKETDDLARGLGLNTYFDYRVSILESVTHPSRHSPFSHPSTCWQNFENLPKGAAAQYGDARYEKSFSESPMTKFFCLTYCSFFYQIYCYDACEGYFRAARFNARLRFALFRRRCCLVQRPCRIFQGPE